jgi:hypothetical protein
VAVLQGNAKQGSVRGFYPKNINGSLRFNDDDSAYLSWTPASAGNRKTWTYSVWVKRSNLVNSDQAIISANTDANNRLFFYWQGSGVISFYHNVGGSAVELATSAVFRDPSAWYHFVISVDTTQATASDRLKFYVNGVQQSLTATSGAGYVSQNTDTQWNNTGTHYIGKKDTTGVYYDGYYAEVHFTDGTAYDADAFGELKNGVWVAKEVDVTYGTNGFYLNFQDDTEVEAFNTVLYRGTGSPQSITGMGFKPDLVWFKGRFSGASYNHALVDSVRGYDKQLSSSTTSAESTNSAGAGLQTFDSDGFTLGVESTAQGSTNTSGESYVAWCWDAGANNAVTGHSSVTWTGDGSTNPRNITGFGFKPDLVWIKARNNPYSHRLTDSVRGATKELFTNSTSVESTADSGGHVSAFLSDGFTAYGSTDNNNYNVNNGTFVAWAWDAGDGDPVSNTDGSITSTVKASTTNGFSIVSWTGNGSTNQSVGHGLSSAPSLMFHKKRDASGSWYVTGSLLGTDGYMFLDTTEAQLSASGYFPSPTSSVFYVSGTNSGSLNNSNDYISYCFHDVTGKQKFGSYTGTGSAGLSVTTGFRPGWLMVKRTNTSGNSWAIWDGSRNPLNTMDGALFANSSGTEDVNATNYIDFNDDGFTIQNTSAFDNADGSTYIYAAFAGSYSDYITDYNTDGSIDSRVKANDTTGFSIVKYTGEDVATATIGHGLSTAPDFIITKVNDVDSWAVYHSALGATKYLTLNTTDAAGTSSSWWNNTAPTTSVYSIGGSGRVNTVGKSQIAYCWAEKSGYSKFGSYTGDGTTDGSLAITTGFKPAFVLIKRTDSAHDWCLLDNTRDTSNPSNVELLANVSDAEYVAERINFTDTGFSLVNSGGRVNASGGTYIYAAFADTREAAFWLDQSGNDNDWQPVNLDHNDTVADSPTNNFCVFNPLKKQANTVFSDGNLKVSSTDAGSAYCQFSTIVMSSGKYYAEFTINTAASAYPHIGIGDLVISENTNRGLGSANGAGYQQNGSVRVNDTTIDTFATFTAGDVISVAYDADNNRLYFAKNGTWINSGDPVAGTGYFSPAAPVQGYVFASSTYQPGSFTANFGQQPFKYDPPA